MEMVPLWEGPAPNAKGDGPEDRPCLHVFRPEAGKANGAGLIVCPGGGYQGLAMSYEGVEVCRWFSRLGGTAFLLTYRVGSGGYTPDDAFTDAQRAMRLVRHRAAQYGIDPERVGMIGFSAGGHLASRMGLTWRQGDPQAEDEIARASDRPAFLLLCYTPTAAGRWPDGGTSSPAITASVPPSFVLHTTEDQVVAPDDVIAWYQALRAAGVETEMHLFGGYGPHGCGLGNGNPVTGQWPTLAAAWMRRNAFLTAQPRASVEGTITVDGAPLGMGYVTFLPTGSDVDPIACAMLTGGTGQYRIAEEDGPTPGTYRVEVRSMPFGRLTGADLRGEVCYTELSPGAGPVLVEIGPGGNTVDLSLVSQGRKQ